jgi:ABC-type transport system involved in cytochrome bd biosynthesis fused ATPase/permease subunit
MKQRISFARALLKSSKILLLDEVTKELDGELTDKVLTLVLEAAKSKLVLLVSHRPEDGEKINATTIKL